MKALFAAAILIASGTAVAQERDARGIPVVSDPATPPPGVNQSVTIPQGATVVPAPNQQEMFATRPGDAEYPACTRERTDNCVQAYERGSARPR